MEEPFIPEPDDVVIDALIRESGHNFVNYCLTQAEVSTALEKIPVQYRDILKLPKEEQEKWKKAMDDEIKSIEERKVWTLVDCPPDRKPVKCRWVFARKSDGRYKARLVAKGFSQVFGEDFEDTFSPIT